MHDVFSSEIFLLLEYFSPWSFATFLGRRILFSHYTSIPWLTQPTERTSQRINREIKKIAPLEIIPLSKSEKKEKNFIYPYPTYFDIQQPNNTGQRELS